MKKIIIGIAVVLFILAALLLSAPEDIRDNKIDNEKPTVKIGVSLPLTGNVGYAAQPAKIAAEMALAKWQQKDTKYNYELIIEDDRMDLKTISLVWNKLKNRDKVNSIISFWGISGKAFTEVNNINKNPIPHIACSWGTTIEDGKYNFNNDTSIERNADLLVKKLKKDNIKNIGLVFQNTSSDIEMQEVITEKLNNASINITFNENFNFGEKDYRTFLSKVKNKPTEIIYFQILINDLEVFYKQLIELNMKLPLTTIAYFDELENKTPYEGFWFIRNLPGDKEFIEKWNKDENPTIRSCTLNTYDDIDILINAFENAPTEEGGVPTSESIINYLQTMDTWDGAMGELTFEKNGRIDSLPELAIIKNGKVELLEE